ncbi:MAG TPA: galactokinase [Ruminococcus sp.]|nr:galactokinase [Ruminococcus sp.]
MNINNIKNNINSSASDRLFAELYGSQTARQKKRYCEAVDEFKKIFPDYDDVSVYSAPGRTEIGGNHTDHQNGQVLAAAVNLDIIAIAAFHDEPVIRIKSKGFEMDTIDISDLSVKEDEKGKSSALIRGIVSRFEQLGYKTGGFDAYTTSDVLKGSGLSSSAAFEVLIGTILNEHFNSGRISPVEIAVISQYSENEYFGKKSGLMDQMVSSVGGFAYIDFKNPQNPEIKKIDCDFDKTGYTLCISDTKGSHSDLTDDYVAIPYEMKQIAQFFGKSVLREVDEAEFYRCIPQIRENISDRAVLRSAHFFAETKRAEAEAKSLENNDFNEFLKLVNQSGKSSYQLLQNAYSCKNPAGQGIPLGIMISERILDSKGAVRVHGGGFAGTVQAFVPNSLINDYSNEINRIFGENSCHIMHIRPYGGLCIII